MSLQGGQDFSYHHKDLPDLSSATFDTETLSISSPKPAFTMQLPSRLRLQPTQGEITPPPSPPATERPPARPESNGSKFAPLLNRASSVLSSRRQSLSPRRPSPTREGAASPSRSPLRSPIPEEGPASSATTSSPSSAQRATKAAAAFADFFQGSSEVVNGFSMAPKRADSYYATASRPGHSRKNSAMSAAASFFGRASPTKHHRIPDEEVDDEILNLDVDEELFPRGVPRDIGLADFDDLRGNAEKLFMRMQIAYEQKLEALKEQRAVAEAQSHDLRSAESRANHIKSQWTQHAQEQDGKTQKLQDELAREKRLRQAEKETRTRTLRMVSKEQQPTLDYAGIDGHRLFSGDRGDGLYDLSNAGFDSGDESDGSASGKSWSPPQTPYTVSRSESPERPGWPGMGAASMMEENLKLKARVAELEETVDGCLGLVAGL